MMIKGSNKKFETCPEFSGKAVCVDVTPLRKQQSQYGERDVFKLVFEVDMEREDGSRYCVWSRGFTPSVNEKASFRKFLRSWFGRDLTREEMAGFDTDSLIGKPAQVVIVQEHRDQDTYANIVACTPDKSSEPLEASGKFVRAKDKVQGAGDRGQGSAGGYRRMEGMAASQQGEGGDGGHAAVKVHIGRCKGLELRDLAPEQVQALVEKWLPTARVSAKPLADDRRLMAALEWWQQEQAATAKAQDDDNVPY